MSKDTISVNMNVYDIPILVEQLEKANKEIKILKNDLIEIKSYLTISKARLRLSSQYVTLFRDRYDKVMKILDRTEELKGSDR